MIAQIQYRKRGAVAAVWANIPGEALVSTLPGPLAGRLSPRVSAVGVALPAAWLLLAW